MFMTWGVKDSKLLNANASERFALQSSKSGQSNNVDDDSIFCDAK